jgi:HK97 gp10 family phage protein
VKTTVEIQGVETLQRRFQELTSRLQGQVLAKAARAAAMPVRDSARKLAPRDTGSLADRGIVSKAMKRTKTYSEFAVGHRLDHFYGKFQELGVAPYAVKVGRKKWGAKGASDSRRRIIHPGHRAQPHLRPAFDQEKDTAEKQASDVLFEAIMTAIRRS